MDDATIGTDYLEYLALATEIAGIEAPKLVQPSDEDIILGRRRSHYLEWGSPDAPPIVFLHGGGLTAHTWDLVCLSLCETYRCLALDLRGHGDSEWSREMDYSIESYASDVRALVETLDLGAPVLVGQSLGGIVSVRYAEEHPLTALVVVDVGPVTVQTGGSRIRQFMQTDAELDSVDEFVQRALEFNPRRHEGLLRRSIMNNLTQLVDGKWTWKYDRRHHGRIDLERFSQERAEIWANVGRIACPALLARGVESDVLPPDDAVAFADALPNGRLVEIEGAGHTVQGDNPRALVRAITDFLGEVAA